MLRPHGFADLTACRVSFWRPVLAIAFLS